MGETPMSQVRMPILATIAATALGCQSTPKPQRIDPAVWQSPRGVVAGSTGPVVVAEGPVPLVYQAIQGGSFHVTDPSTQVELARFKLKEQEIVLVGARGVFVGDNAIAGLTLAKDHPYTIYYDPPGDSGVHWENRHQERIGP